MTDAEPAPPTQQIYFREDGDGGVEWASQPPVGSLDGWHAANVPADTWTEYEEARRSHERAVVACQRTDSARERATDLLWRSAGVGRVLGRTR